MDMAIAQEVVRRAHQNFVLLFNDAELRQGGLPFEGMASANFDDSQGIAIVADQLEFALYAQWHVIPAMKM